MIFNCLFLNQVCQKGTTRLGFYHIVDKKLGSILQVQYNFVFAGNALYHRFKKIKVSLNHHEIVDDTRFSFIRSL